MCGIFGLAVSANHNIDFSEWESAVNFMFELSETRGKEAAGIAIGTNNTVGIYKDSTAASNMVKSRQYKKMVGKLAGKYFANKDGVLSAIGHSRLVTNGLQGIDTNNQPVLRDECVVVHNGIVVNVEKLWDEHKEDITSEMDVDTEVIAALISKHRKDGLSISQAVSKTLEQTYGETTIAVMFQDINVMVLATNTGSLFVSELESKSAFFFSSEDFISGRLSKGDRAVKGFKDSPYRQIKPGNGLILDLDTLEVTDFAFGKKMATPELAPRLAINRRIEEKSLTYKTLREGMQRCTKCILPETMPYIEFDDEGVCNFCHSHKKTHYKPVSELEALLDKYKGIAGKRLTTADSLVAFSGGRDSSYGLHLLKNEFGMSPIAYTYDWGMVTDLARRNQARICGKLGIEHIWVSADIKKNRANIRRNVHAWMKKPHLGVIPLFIAGDKALFWHANKLMKETELPLMVLCTNSLEKTEFKTGFLGVSAKNTTIHTPRSLPIFQKIQMPAKYLMRFMENPRYINKSMLSTMFAYYSYYVIEQDYLSIFDYWEWNEKEIDDTLINEYEWETSPDSSTTWRIGDGTASFYNYIYHMVAGFTEHDTFRSNQVRDGMITRDEALAFVENENKPRWESIREYTNLINIDFDEVVRVIDRIPKLYDPEASGK